MLVFRRWCSCEHWRISDCHLLLLLLPVLATGNNSSNNSCTPAELAVEQLAAWVDNIIAIPPPASSPHNRRKRATTQQQSGFYGDGVIVSDSIGSGNDQCSLQTLCYPSVTAPVVCYWNRQACDGVRNCATGRDELYCDDSLSQYYQVTNGVQLDVSQSTIQGWPDVNLKACARVCNDVYTGCVAFSFNPLNDGLDRCTIYLNARNKWVSSPGTATYVREPPSRPRLAPPDITPQQIPSAQIAVEPPFVNCWLRDMYQCGSSLCLPYSQVCDGIRHCTSSDDELLCPTYTGLWNRAPGSTINSYSIPEPRLSLGGCAAFCLFHISKEPKCDVFSYVASTQECRIGCSTCGNKLDILPDNSADYFSLSVDSSSSSLVSLLDVALSYNLSSIDLTTLRSRVNSLTDSLSERGFTVTTKPISQLLSTDATEGILQANPTSAGFAPILSTVNSQITSALGIIPSPSSVTPITSTRPLFGAGSLANFPTFDVNAANSGGGGFSGQFGSFTTPPPAPTPPLVTSQQLLPADCGRRPLASLAAADQLTQSRVLQRSDTSNRLVAGHRASAGTYPWQAQIQAYNPDGFWEHHCGGVVITARHVLTAAHCLTRTLTALQVVVGQHDRRDASEQHEQTFAIENALAHPEYRTDSSSIYANDIAVLKLRLRQDRAVQFSTHVQPLCLPSATRAAPLQDASCEISGWGKTDALAPDTPLSAADVLHGGVVPLVSDNFCASAEVYGGRFLPERMLCAGSVRGGTDACQGDSGGPLACRRPDGTWQLTGIVSFGSGCGGELRPGVYTEVGFYKPWIQRVIEVV